MIVTDISIFYRRQVQPAQYEAEEVRLEGRATVADGESWEAAAYDMLARARVQSHRVLGLPEPNIALFEGLGDETSPEQGGVVADPRNDARPREAIAPKRTRRTKAEMEAARAAEASPAAVTLEAAVPTVVTHGDDIVIEGLEPVLEPPAEITDRELQTASGEAAKRAGIEKVKNVMREYGIARLGELAQEKRQGFLADLAVLKAA